MTAVYVHHLNIQRFERLLAEERDPERRRLIERLLAEERARDPGEALGRGQSAPAPHTP